MKTIVAGVIALVLVLALGQVLFYFGRVYLDHELAAELPGLAIAAFPFVQRPFENFIGSTGRVLARTRTPNQPPVKERHEPISNWLSAFLRRWFFRLAVIPPLSMLVTGGWFLAAIFATMFSLILAGTQFGTNVAGFFPPEMNVSMDSISWGNAIFFGVLLAVIVAAEMGFARFFFHRLRRIEAAWFLTLPTLVGLLLFIASPTKSMDFLYTKAAIYSFAFMCLIQPIFLLWERRRFRAQTAAA